MKLRQEKHVKGTKLYSSKLRNKKTKRERKNSKKKANIDRKNLNKAINSRKDRFRRNMNKVKLDGIKIKRGITL